MESLLFCDGDMVILIAYMDVISNTNSRPLKPHTNDAFQLTKKESKGGFKLQLTKRKTTAFRSNEAIVRQLKTTRCRYLYGRKTRIRFSKRSTVHFRSRLNFKINENLSLNFKCKRKFPAQLSLKSVALVFLTCSKVAELKIKKML